MKIMDNGGGGPGTARRRAWGGGGAIRRERSWWWFLLPVLMGAPGGIIAWFALRYDDPQKASNCLWLGAGLMAVSLVLSAALGEIVPYDDARMNVWR